MQCIHALHSTTESNKQRSRLLVLVRYSITRLVMVGSPTLRYSTLFATSCCAAAAAAAFVSHKRCPNTAGLTIPPLRNRLIRWPWRLRREAVEDSPACQCQQQVDSHHHNLNHQTSRSCNRTAIRAKQRRDKEQSACNRSLKAPIEGEGFRC